jgi:mutator protein MutT
MERLKIKTAVYILVKQENKILLLRRYNTGWCDGFFTLPSGHIDEGELPLEAAVRELKEEVNIDIDEDKMKFCHVSYERDLYIDFYFLLENLSLQPELNEPDKCDLVEWVEIDSIKDAFIVPKVKDAILSYLSGKMFLQIDRGLGN